MPSLQVEKAGVIKPLSAVLVGVADMCGMRVGRGVPVTEQRHLEEVNGDSAIVER